MAPKPVVPVVKNLEEAKGGRTQKVEQGGKRVVIKEADKRTIVRQGDKVVIQKDEAAQLQRVAPGAVITRDKLGTNTAVVERPNNVKIITETDRNGQLVRRFRRDGHGRETAILDNRRRKKNNFGRNLAIGVGVGAGLIAGAAILNSVVNVPEPVVRVPREKYIVRYEDASEDDVYEALNAPPVDESEDSAPRTRYTLDQVRATPRLRERMRRVDLDDINFETGSWEVDPAEYRKLERIARAMNRVIARNPNEVFLIEGYTDAVGSDVDNLTLSDRRAEAVSVVLSEQFEVPFENLTTQGYGEEYLKVETEDSERANRRVAVRRITPLLAQDESAAAAPPPPPRVEERRYDDGDSFEERRERRRKWRKYRQQRTYDRYR
ncbi:MAG: OmpA family protein [Hyphomicrobium sp.]|nr:OmpA family protein [Hyphomicrobium sp.]